MIAVCLLIGLEIAVRAVHRARHGAWGETEATAFHRQIEAARSLYRRHPFLNVAPNEGAKVEAFGKQASWNALGYRSPERSIAKPPGVYRVVCAGGSTTFDLAAAGDDRTWPWRLEEALRAATGRQIEVWNAGFPGWTSVENLVSLALRDLDLRPDLILFYQGINDLQPAAHAPFDRQYEHGHAGQHALALGFGLPSLRWHQRSLLVESLRRALFGPESPWEQLIAAPSPERRSSALPAAAVAIFERNVRSFVALAQSQGADVLLLTQPLRIRTAHAEADLGYLAGWIPGLTPEAVPEALERLNDVSRSVAADASLSIVDAARSIAWRDDDFDDPMHLTESGNDRLLALLVPAVASLAEAEDRPGLAVPAEATGPGALSPAGDS